MVVAVVADAGDAVKDLFDVVAGELLWLVEFRGFLFVDLERIVQEDTGEGVHRPRHDDSGIVGEEATLFGDGQAADVVDVRVRDEHRVDLPGFDPAKRGELSRVGLFESAIDEVVTVTSLDVIARPADFFDPTAGRDLKLAHVHCLGVPRTYIGRVDRGVRLDEELTSYPTREASSCRVLGSTSRNGDEN